MIPQKLPDAKKDMTEFMRLARERYERCYDAEHENRQHQLDDLKFRAGEQYTESEREERKNRPALTFDRTGSFVRQVTGDIRRNTPQIQVRPVGEGSDEKIADIFTGLIRNIQQVSRARHAYAVAADNATTCGEGAFRITTEYANDKTFDLDIRIRRITDAFAVLFDENATELDRSDAMYCFVVGSIGKEEFKARYPDEVPNDFDMSGLGLGDTQRRSLWQTDDTVTIAEYWVKVPDKATLILLSNGQTIREDDPITDDLREKMDAGEVEEVRRREIDTHKVVQYIISGTNVLDGPTDWPTQDIPIIPVIGEELHIGERVIKQGIVRPIKGAQKAYNLMRSTSIETVASQPIAPFAGTPRQMEGFEGAWARAANENFPILPYNPDPDAPGPPFRLAPPQASSGLIQETALLAEDMKATLGIYDASLGARSNETSGVAIQARQREGDTGTFHYVDNLALAIETCGRQLVRLIPKIYDTERTVRILEEDGTEKTERINSVDEYGKALNDITLGDYDVVVQTGPAFSTRRQEAAAAMTEALRAAPQLMTIAGDIWMGNQDWPGASDLQERMRRFIEATNPAILLDEEEYEAFKQAQAQQGQQPTPEMIEAQTNAAETAAKIGETQAKTAKIEADTAKTQLEVAVQSGELGAMMQQMATIAAQQAVAATLQQLAAVQPSPGLAETAPGTGPVSPGF